MSGNAGNTGSGGSGAARGSGPSFPPNPPAKQGGSAPVMRAVNPNPGVAVVHPNGLVPAG